MIYSDSVIGPMVVVEQITLSIALYVNIKLYFRRL